MDSCLPILPSLTEQTVMFQAVSRRSPRGKEPRPSIQQPTGTETFQQPCNQKEDAPQKNLQMTCSPWLKTLGVTQNPKIQKSYRNPESWTLMFWTQHQWATVLSQLARPAQSSGNGHSHCPKYCLWMPFCITMAQVSGCSRFQWP